MPGGGGGAVVFARRDGEPPELLILFFIYAISIFGVCCARRPLDYFHVFYELILITSQLQLGHEICIFLW